MPSDMERAPVQQGRKMFGWYAEFDGKGKKTFWACFLGYGLDAFDLQIYSFVMPVLVGLWSMSNTQAGLIATSALAISALGGWLAGMLADKIGRVRLLQITVAWFAFFTFLSGFANSFEQLLIIRGLQGLGFGGEWAAGAVLIGEIAKARHRGKAVGMVQSAWSWGWGLAALMATLAFQLLSPEVAWRLMFFIGILPAGLIFFVRRMVPESEVYLQTQQEPGERRSVFSIFSKDLLYTTFFGSLMAVAHGGYYAITTWLPTFLRTERQLSNIGSGGYLAVVIVGSFVGYMTSAYLSDYLGRRRTIMLFALGAMVMVVGYTQADISNGLMLFLGFPLGFLSSGIFSGFGPFYTELFPTSVRGTGQGFCYNFGRGCAAGVPALVGFISAQASLGKAIYIVAGCAYVIVIAAALCLPETRGRELRSN